MNLFTICITAAITAAIIAVTMMEMNRKADFMDECQKHQPKYQCTALWLASQPDTVTVYHRGN